jgi:hypothetical protein
VRQLGVGLLEQGGTDAQGHGFRCLKHGARLLRERFAQALAQRLRGWAGDAAQQNHELVPAQPCGQCAVGQHAADEVAQGHQQAVAGIVTVQVVDLLEVVDVDQQQGTGAGRRGLCQQLRCAQIERAAVVQGGQRVAGGDLRDTLLAAMALGAGHGHRKQHDRHHAFHQRDHNHRPGNWPG